MGLIEKVGVGHAGSGENNRRGCRKEPSPIFFLPDPAHSVRPTHAFLIVPTDRKPGTGYTFNNLQNSMEHLKNL